MQKKGKGFQACSVGPLTIGKLTLHCWEVLMSLIQSNPGIEGGKGESKTQSVRVNVKTLQASKAISLIYLSIVSPLIEMTSMTSKFQK